MPVTDEQRIEASRRWRDLYAEANRSKNNHVKLTIERALSVFVLDNALLEYLAVNDPQALKQAQLALNGSSWENHIKEL